MLKGIREEVKYSHIPRYLSTNWNGQDQPIQNVLGQYKTYVNDGYTNKFFKDMKSHTQHLGVWITCFVAFLQKDKEVIDFLDLWYVQTLKYTTQDQIGFPYVCYKTKLIPFTLPNDEIKGDCSHKETMFYIKHPHGNLTSFKNLSVSKVITFVGVKKKIYFFISI